MKIALIGYGKMGREIEKAAEARGHEIILRLSSADKAAATPKLLSGADVAIEFTRPEAAVSNIKFCFEADIPVVVGTTGWYNQLDEVKKLCEGQGKSFLYASNFSVGVNILFELNSKLAQAMNRYSQYDVSISEIHHTKKIDSPSGTAITLANTIIENIDRKSDWVLSENDADEHTKSTEAVIIHTERIGDTTGTHTVRYASANDILELRHEALNRSGFAEGAVIAAEWLVNKKGFFTMSDVLNFKS